MPVRLLTKKDEPRWDAFVRNCATGTFFHLTGWKTVIERAFKHATYYLLHERAGQITGILPLVHVRSRLFSNALISTPFCVYGGILADAQEALLALEQAAVALAEKLEVSYLEMRQLRPQHPEWPSKSLYYTFRRAIEADPQANFLSIPRKQRAMIRKGMEAGLRSVVENDVDRLYRVYSESVRNLGTPVFSRRYLQLLMETFDGVCDVVTVLHGARAVGSVMNFYYRDEVLPYYGGGTAAARNLKANDFLYWEVMRRAAEGGVRLFDFGRSKENTGSFHFKKHWGFEPQPLHYQYHLRGSNSLPDISPANPSYGRAIAVWQRLPVIVTQWLGPWLARSLG